MKKLLLLAVFLLVPFQAEAVLLNGNFETGSLSPWQAIGDVLLVDSSFGVDPPQGHQQLLMTNAPMTWSDDPNAQSYSGTFSAYRLLLFPFFAPANPGLFNPYEGSGIKQTFTANTDILLSFTWQYLTDEGGYGLLDRDFMSLDSLLYELIPGIPTPILRTVGSNSPSPPIQPTSSLTPFAQQYDAITSTIFIPAGVHTIGFGVVDGVDPFFNSGLLVDDISFRAAPAPEPAAWLLLSFGLLAFIAAKGNRKCFGGWDRG